MISRRSCAGLLGVAVLAIAAPAVARSSAILVLPASGSGVSSAYVQQARRLFVGTLDAGHRHSIVDMERPPLLHPYDDAEAMVLGRSFNAAVVIMLHLGREGDLTTLWVRALDVGTGQVAFLGHEETRAGPEALAEMAGALAVRADLRLVDLMNTIRRRNPKLGFVIGELTAVAVTWPEATLGQARALPILGLGYMRIVASMLVDVTARVGGANGATTADYGYRSQDRTFADVGMGAYTFMPAPSSWRPHLGVSLRWGYLDFRGLGVTSGAIAPTVGLLHVGETLAVRASVAYLWAFTAERGPDRLIPHATEGVHDQGVMLQLQVGL